MMVHFKGFFFIFVFLSFFQFAAVGLEEQTVAPGKSYYTVKKGDTLSSISRKYGVDIKDLIAVNHIQNANKIKIGQTIIIPQTYVTPKTPAPAYTAPVQTEPEVVQTQPPLIFTESTPEEVVIVEEHYHEPVHEGSYREWVGASFSWWFATLDAQVRVTEGPIVGTEIDLVDDLGVDDSIGIPIVNAWVQPLSWLKIQAEYMATDIDGQRTINEDIVFDGETFSISDNVRGELEIDRFSGWVEINPFNGDWGYLGLMVGGEYVHLEGILSSDLVGSISDEFDAGTVTFGGQIGINLTPELQLRARGRGMTFDVEDVEVDVFDIQAGLSYTLLDHFEIAAYYRYLSLDVKADDDEGDLTLDGPVISAAIKI
jgi:LysM repeat protein